MLARPAAGEPERELLRTEKSPFTTTECSESSDDLEVLTPIAARVGVPRTSWFPPPSRADGYAGAVCLAKEHLRGTVYAPNE